ncbi:MAG: hypothetical protein HY795_08120 [Desulfovibrio sp.]|nr:hypothetical protein [Desulfovibrio sp.]MBI4961075.1 hypothetical protein [Desulfovibrio sp.]
MTGEHYVYASSFANRNFTGWSLDGTQTEDPFTIWQRLRLRTDYTQGDNLAFSLWLQVNNTPWGNGTLTVDNPAVAVQIFKAYLQFKWPGSDVEITAGKQTVTLPQSEGFWGSIVLDSEFGALAANIPLNENAHLVVGYGRLLSYVNALEDLSLSPRDIFDLAFATLPLTSNSFSFTPWAALGLFMNDGVFRPYTGVGGPPDLGYIRQEMLSLGYFASNPGFRQASVPYMWAGTAAKFTAGDFTFFSDIVAGAGGLGDASKNLRHGVFLDAALQYGGLSRATPRIFGWWSSGEDADTRNGTERLPAIVRTWNSGASYLFSTGQTFDNTTSINASPIGAWGFGASLDNIEFIHDLSSRMTALYMRGTNDPAPLRRSVLSNGPGYMVAMGKNLRGYCLRSAISILYRKNLDC